MSLCYSLWLFSTRLITLAPRIPSEGDNTRSKTNSQATINFNPPENRSVELRSLSCSIDLKNSSRKWLQDQHKNRSVRRSGIEELNEKISRFQSFAEENCRNPSMSAAAHSDSTFTNRDTKTNVKDIRWLNYRRGRR